jgi:hypothetical protein
MCQKGDMKEGPTKIRRHSTKFSRLGDLASRICETLSYIVSVHLPVALIFDSVSKIYLPVPVVVNSLQFIRSPASVDKHMS